MKKKKKTLLDLDRVPTLDELRAYFREENDFSAAAYIDMDYDKLDSESVEMLEHIKGLMDEKWEPLSREMGLKSDSAYYGKDNPLIAMRDNMENLVAGGVMKLITEKPDLVNEILATFMDDPDVEKHADDFLNNAVKTAMQVMNYEETAQLFRRMQHTRISIMINITTTARKILTASGIIPVQN
jgi:TusA-related sulfurtransferase